MLVWRTNFKNPYELLYTPSTLGDETYAEALNHARALYDRFIKGRPQATDAYTVEELESMGMIGLYEDIDHWWCPNAL